MYEEERRLYCPAILELESVKNLFSSTGHRAVHTDMGPQSRKTT